MGERRQVSRGADTALRRYPGCHAAGEQFAERIDHDGTHAGVSLGERVGAQQYHGPGFGDTEWLAHADCVRADEVDLQFADLVAGDADIAEFADTGGDGIGNLVIVDEVVDHGAGSVDAFAGVGGEQDRPAFQCYLADGFKREIVSADVKGVQEMSSQFSVVSSQSRPGAQASTTDCVIWYLSNFVI